MALGTASSTPGTWPARIHIISDMALVLGEKIPPIVPTLIDVRITDFQSSADLPH